MAREGEYDPDRPLLPFLLTIAHRRAIDHIRKKTTLRCNEKELLDAVANSLADTQVGEAWKNVTASQDGQKMLKLIRDVITEMPERQRQVSSVIIDCYPDNLSIEETREELFRRTGERPTALAVKRARQEARKKIRKQLVSGGFLET